jgi:phosphoribosylanthranilate isomerase
MVKLKICCINSHDEAKTAISAGADLLGLVADMPSGEGMIEDDKIREIAASIKSFNNSVLLTSRTDAESIIEHHKETITSHIQIVDYIDVKNYQEIRKSLPDIKLIQVVHVEDESSYSLAMNFSSYVDFILLDSGKPSAKKRTLGGTGDTHNWNISKKIVRDCSIPVYLAGGINHSNVVEAIQKVKPYGIDLCTGLRTNNKLDKNKLNVFMEAIKRA